ncbi:SulP family inorganic anion transporter [Methanolapillus millepedarum]|uniref:Sulfate transporter n=1 Tax=Methanolapillus millepedarum TaxID=3028296 RepID=A0AA96V3Y2_9EURY|nr:putative sulfate transporter [Methanosarcinaceae archaeon Ac7]
MFNHIFITLKGYKKSYLKNDLIAGIVVAALTIPVAMGYAQIAGLPAIYGLYAAILPMIGYAFLATSKQLVMGPDSAASAITGSVVVSLGIALGSDDVLSIAPVLTFFAAVFLLLFAVLKAGRFASYISTPVVSGFLSGISLSVILRQIPKAMGVAIPDGSVFSQLWGILSEIPVLNIYALLLAVGTVLIVFFGKKFLPKLPMALVVLILGTVVTYVFGLDQLGVSIVGEIPKGLPSLMIPDLLSFPNLPMGILSGLIIAVVVFSDSIMTAKSFALKNRYDIDENRELFAFSAANFLSAFSGASPVSASTSCTASNDQYHGNTQAVSLVAAGVIAVVVAVFSGLLYYMPQPVLAGIIIAAVAGVVDVRLAKSLFKESRSEFWIWVISLGGVLFVGVLFGVLVGVILSFVDVIRGITAPTEAYLGKIEGKKGVYDLKSHKDAKPIDGIVIYRFSARLFFGNIDLFSKGIEKALTPKPKAVIVDASGINNIDVTASDSLEVLIKSLQEDGIEFYFAHIRSDVEQDLRNNDLGSLIDSGHTTKTIEEALLAIEAD